MNEILTKLEQIINYGIGYNDIAGYIAIPLIIALFAFSFPFIFNEVNRINSKYQSDAITELFRRSNSYKFFFMANSLSIFSLFIYGILSLIFKDQLRSEVLYWGNWVLLLLVAITSCAILIFVKRCIVFNNSFKIPDKIFDNCQKNIDSFIRKNWRKRLQIFFKNRILKKVNPLTNYNINTFNFGKKIVTSEYRKEFIKIMGEIARYNLSASDLNHLRFNVNYTFEKCREFDNDPSTNRNFYSLYFLETVFKVYSENPTKKEIYETLFSKLFSVFNKTKLIEETNMITVVRMMSYLSANHLWIPLHYYLEHSTYRFNFLIDYSQNLRIIGKSGDEIRRAGGKSKECVELLRCYHYLLLGKFLHDGNYKLFEYFRHKDIRSRVALYPSNGVEVISTYMKCLSHLGGDGFDFHIIDSENIFNEKIYLSEMLNRLTVVMLQLVSGKTVRNFTYISKSEIMEFASLRVDLKKCFLNLKKTNPELQSLGIFDSNFDDNLNNNIIDALYVVNGLDPYESLNKIKEEKGYYNKTDILNTLKCQLIPTYIIENLKEDVINKFLDFKDIVKYELGKFFNMKGDGSEGESSYVDSIIYYISKKLPYDRKVEARTLNRFTLDIYSEIYARIYYQTLGFFRNYKVKVKRITPGNLNNYLASLTKGEPDKYVLIDVSSPFKHLLIGVKGGDRMMREVPRLELENTRNSSWRELPNYKYFDESLILIEKRFMPDLIFEASAPRIEFSKPAEDRMKSLFIAVDFHPGIKVFAPEKGEMTLIKLKNV